MDSCRDEYQVTVKPEEVVLAVLPMLEHLLPISNLDLLLPALDVGIFLCYKKSSQETHESSSSSMVMVSAVKKALAETLSSFYAFAGEVVQNRRGEPELLCNNSGVDFNNAYADVELKHLDLYHPDASVHGKLVPFKKRGVLAVQVTELKCGGLVIGCTFDHRVADAHSANMFLVAWAGIAQGKAPSSHVPTLKRSLLTPRRPPHYHSSIDNMYVFIKSLPPPINPEPSHDDHDHLISRIYYVQAEVIDQLQSQASSNGSSRSKLVTFSAFLWKLIAEAGSDCSKKCKLGIVVDGRERLRGRGDAANLCMQNYFGNVLSIPYSEASVGELKAMPLCLVADDVHAFLEGATNEEHFLGLIDWVELHRPEKAIVKVYCKGSNDEAAVVVSSGQRFPVSRLDFGWGQPAFGSYHFPWGGQTGYVMPMPSTSRDGDWIVYMHLLKKHLDLVETEAPNVFRPLCPAYLNLIA